MQNVRDSYKVKKSVDTRYHWFKHSVFNVLIHEIVKQPPTAAIMRCLQLLPCSVHYGNSVRPSATLVHYVKQVNVWSNVFNFLVTNSIILVHPHQTLLQSSVMVRTLGWSILGLSIGWVKVAHLKSKSKGSVRVICNGSNKYMWCIKTGHFQHGLYVTISQKQYKIMPELVWSHIIIYWVMSFRMSWIIFKGHLKYQNIRTTPWQISYFSAS